MLSYPSKVGTDSQSPQSVVALSSTQAVCFYFQVGMEQVHYKITPIAKDCCRVTLIVPKEAPLLRLTANPILCHGAMFLLHVGDPEETPFGFNSDSHCVIWTEFQSPCPEVLALELCKRVSARLLDYNYSALDAASLLSA